jgi:hypothetical protein
MKSVPAKLLALLLLLPYFLSADVHPALKDAVDKNDIKMARNLIENVGVQDIYCPASLQPKDAFALYGKRFSNRPDSLFAMCDSTFSRDYINYACVQLKDTAFCRVMLDKSSPASWPESYSTTFCSNKKDAPICARLLYEVPLPRLLPYLRQIKKNNLYSMREIKVQQVRYPSKSECADYFSQMRTADEEVRNAMAVCASRSRNSTERTICQSAVRDQASQLHSGDAKIKKRCAKASNTARMVDEKSEGDFVFSYAFYKKDDDIFHYTRDPLADFNREYLNFYPMFVSAGVNVWISEKDGLKNLKDIYARDGMLSNEDRTFYCRIYPDIDEKLNKMLGVSVLSCKDHLQKIAQVRAMLADTACEVTGKLVNTFDSVLYVCDSGKYRLATDTERVVGGLCMQANEGVVYDEFLCRGGRYVKAEWADRFAGHSCTAKNEGEFIAKKDETDGSFLGIVCASGEYRGATPAEAAAGHVCSAKFDGEMVAFSQDVYVCDATKYRLSTDLERVIGKACIQKNANEKVEDKYGPVVAVCVNREWTYKVRVDSVKLGNKFYKTMRFGRQTWFAKDLSKKVAAEDAIKACPLGSHLPTEQELMPLVEYVPFVDPDAEERVYSDRYFLKDGAYWLSSSCESNFLRHWFGPETRVRCSAYFPMNIASVRCVLDEK